MLTKLRQELPDEKFYLFINRLTFSLLFICVGLPLWYSTTSTHRAPLPYSRIEALAQKPIATIDSNLTSFQTASSYEISFYLINNNDAEHRLDPALFQEKIASIVLPYLSNTYSTYIDMDLSTEILHNTRGMLPNEQGHNLERRQIPFFINKLEHFLHRSTKHYREKIFFVLFVPDGKQSPITIEQQIDNAIIVPKWGSVTFFNRASPSDVSTDLDSIMKQFLAHFERLLGIDTIERWATLRTMENFSNGRQTLLTLSQLLQSIPNIVIDNAMAKKVHESVELLEHCQDQSNHDQCQRGRLLADQVFFDPSLLKLLYFPDDQKFAIYVPLYLPMGAPIALTFLNESLTLGDLYFQMMHPLRIAASHALHAIRR
jgi:GPI-anchor transamidase subunit S